MMMSITPKPLPSQEELHRLFYCVGGVLYWKEKTSPLSRVSVGDKAGSVSGSRGYKNVYLFNESHSYHRIVWKWYYGTDPEGTIDHMDNDRLNNNIWNLQDITAAENLAGKRLSRERGELVRDENGKVKKKYQSKYYFDMLDRMTPEEIEEWKEKRRQNQIRRRNQ